MQAQFDLDEKLPRALQERLDAWQFSPPRRQNQAYGPLTAYLQGTKFPNSEFLLKPQKLLRIAAHDGTRNAMGCPWVLIVILCRNRYRPHR